jgi:hypothetical protein
VLLEDRSAVAWNALFARAGCGRKAVLASHGCEATSGVATVAEASQQGENWPSRQPEAEPGTDDRAAHARAAFG